MNDLFSIIQVNFVLFATLTSDIAINRACCLEKIHEAHLMQLGPYGVCILNLPTCCRK